MAIGAADVIPGISGGTIAFVMGIYEDLLASIKRFWENLDFILPIVSGMGFSIFALAGVVQYLLMQEVYRTWLYSLFLGLILASVWFCCRQITRWSSIQPLLLLLGAAIAFSLTTIKAPKSEGYRVIVGQKEFTNISRETLSAMVSKGIIDADTPVHREGYTYSIADLNLSNTSFVLDLWLVICGAIAITAMLLPGVSGSYMFTILGVYPIVIGAVADSIKGETYAFTILMSVGIGVVLGAVLFSRAVSWMLRQHHDKTVALLVGFMLGALPVVWPFWRFEYFVDPLNIARGYQLQPVVAILPDFDSSVFIVSILLAVIGFVIIVMLERAGSKKRNTFSV